MLSAVYVSLRFIHFITLMVAFGCLLYGAWWAPAALRRLMMQRFYPLMRHLLLASALSALLMLMAQGGLMGNGWPDVWQPAIWQAVAGTQFGGVWVWQILLAFVALVWLKPRRPGRLLLVLFCAQLLLLAGVGHAAMNDGWLGIVQRTNHALHLFCVASWFGGLLPFIYCLRLAHGRWRQAAICTMMRFSRYGHLAVAGAIASGAVNALLIQGGLISASPWGRMLLFKGAGGGNGGNCAGEPVCSGATHVGRRNASGAAHRAHHADRDCAGGAGAVCRQPVCHLGTFLNKLVKS